MVDREQLEALDYLLWRRTGQLAAAAMGCHQATVSRRLACCRESFAIAMGRHEGEWECNITPLLALERHLHQLGRFLGHGPLRIEAFPLGSTWLLDPIPGGWIGGTFDHVGVDRPLQLLRERVIDAWITDAIDDLPTPATAELAVVPLWRSPVQLVVDPCHPLAGERGLSQADLLRFPSLDLPEEGYLRSRALFHARGFGGVATEMRRYDSASWEGRTADQLSLACSTPLNRLATPGFCVLDGEPPFHNGGALVVRLDQADQPAITMLESTLRSRLGQLAPLLPECVPL